MRYGICLTLWSDTLTDDSLPLLDQIKEIGYDNLLMIEAFGLASKKLISALKIWRRMYASERQLAADGLKFMKTEVAKRWT